MLIFRIHSRQYLLLLSLLIASLGYGQEKNIQEHSSDNYGIKGGINYSELWGRDALPESDRKVGYSLGAYGSFKLSNALKFQPEAIWSVQGEDSKNSGRYKISYINLPMMFKWKSGRFYTELGPQLGILTISTAKSVPDSLKLVNLESFDFSINAGFGFEVFDDLSIGVRYIQGLTNIVRNRDLRNSVIYLGFSYKVF